jgi:peptidoglycan-N-acetylglucosamine deacetylase
VGTFSCQGAISTAFVGGFTVLKLSMKTSASSKKWRPSIGLKASALLHVGAVAGMGAGLGWPWALGGVVANHAILTLAGLWPRSTLLGDNMRTLSSAAKQARQVAITIDDGPDPQVTPVVLDILDAWQAQATFFCVGEAVEAHPALAREIIRRGHSIENHSHAHRHHFSLMVGAKLHTEIERAQLAIFNVTGVRPLFFRAPAGLRNPLLDPVLQKMDLRLVSWTRRGFDTITADPTLVAQRLARGLQPADIVLLHDGNAARTADGQAVVVKVLPDLLKAMRELNLIPVALRNSA